MIFYKTIRYSLVAGAVILAWWFTSIVAVVILGCALGVAWYFRDLAMIQVLPEQGEHVLDVGLVGTPHVEFATRESQKITMPWDAVVIDDPDIAMFLADESADGLASTPNDAIVHAP